MADWYARERTVVYHEWVVPVREGRGADWNQVQQAIDAAARKWAEIFYPGIDKTVIPPDDAIRIIPSDSEIVVTFAIDQKEF